MFVHEFELRTLLCGLLHVMYTFIYFGTNLNMSELDFGDLISPIHEPVICYYKWY